jgi:membrane protein YdbS with pleckstrin-like domain
LWGIAKGYALGIVVFTSISWGLLPDWVNQWMSLIKDYIGYVPIKPILGEWVILFGLNWGDLWVKSVGIGLCMAISIFMAIRWWRHKDNEIAFLSFLILFGQLINVNPNSMLSDQLIFLAPLLFWLNQKEYFWPTRLTFWILFISVPWGIFLLNFSGKEPFEVASSLTLLFLIWFVYLLVCPLEKYFGIREGGTISSDT